MEYKYTATLRLHQEFHFYPVMQCRPPSQIQLSRYPIDGFVLDPKADLAADSPGRCTRMRTRRDGSGLGARLRGAQPRPASATSQRVFLRVSFVCLKSTFAAYVI